MNGLQRCRLVQLLKLPNIAGAHLRPTCYQQKHLRKVLSQFTRDCRVQDRWSIEETPDRKRVSTKGHQLLITELDTMPSSWMIIGYGHWVQTHYSLFRLSQNNEDNRWCAHGSRISTHTRVHECNRAASTYFLLNTFKMNENLGQPRAHARTLYYKLP